jgi:diguanylate cyclase (GGDEF)-like protein
VQSARNRIQDSHSCVEFAQGKEKGIATAVVLAALGVCVIALVAIWLALRRPVGRRSTGTLESIDRRLAELDERLTGLARPRAATEAALGWAIAESLELDEVMQRTLIAAEEALQAVDGSRMSVPLPDGTSVTERAGRVVRGAKALEGPPDGSPFVSGRAAWETPDADAIRSGLVVPLGDGSLSVYSSLGNAFDAEAAAVLAAIARRAEPAVRNALRYLESEERAATDELTRLGSARAFSQALPREIATARRKRRPLCLIRVDLDDFGQINNRHPRGHEAGNDALAGFGERVLSTIRESDSAFRNSGGADEFFLILPETSLQDAKRTYARLRADMAAAPFGDVDPVTMSSGLAELGPDDTKESLLKRAYDLMLIAKHSGKDRLVSEGDPQDVRE